jgi:hypothetical protein
MPSSNPARSSPAVVAGEAAFANVKAGDRAVIKQGGARIFAITSYTVEPVGGARVDRGTCHVAFLVDDAEVTITYSARRRSRRPTSSPLAAMNRGLHPRGALAGL